MGAPDLLKQIHRAVLECMPDPLCDDERSDDYHAGWNDCYRMYTRVLVAVEHGLICRNCGAPAHRGPDAATLKALLGKGDNEPTDQPVDKRATEAKGEALV